jgi:hypothetical protein
VLRRAFPVPASAVPEHDVAALMIAAEVRYQTNQWRGTNCRLTCSLATIIFDQAPGSVAEIVRRLRSPPAAQGSRTQSAEEPDAPHRHIYHRAACACRTAGMAERSVLCVREKAGFAAAVAIHASVRAAVAIAGGRAIPSAIQAGGSDDGLEISGQIGAKAALLCAGWQSAAFLSRSDSFLLSEPTMPLARHVKCRATGEVVPQARPTCQFVWNAVQGWSLCANGPPLRSRCLTS